MINGFSLVCIIGFMNANCFNKVAKCDGKYTLNYSPSLFKQGRC